MADGSTNRIHTSSLNSLFLCSADIQGESVCPGREFIANKDGGYISSPNYPLNYGNNLNCLFTLIVPAGKKTHVEFVEMKTECMYK
jgi:hypothetical protein